MKNVMRVNTVNVNHLILDKMVRVEALKYAAVPTESLYRTCLVDTMRIFDREVVPAPVKRVVDRPSINIRIAPVSALAFGFEKLEIDLDTPDVEEIEDESLYGDLFC